MATASPVVTPRYLQARSLLMPLKMEGGEKNGEKLFLSSLNLPNGWQTLMLQEGRAVTVPYSQLCPRNSERGRNKQVLSYHVHRI